MVALIKSPIMSSCATKMAAINMDLMTYVDYYERNVREICRMLDGNINEDALDGLTFRINSLCHLLVRSINITFPEEVCIWQPG